MNHRTYFIYCGQSSEELWDLQVGPSKTQSASVDIPETKAVGPTVSERNYACVFCKTEVFPSDFTWRLTFAAFGDSGKMERTSNAEKQETRAITAFFRNANSTINGMCRK